MGVHMTQPLRIVTVDCDRERYRDLLLLADEQWDMVELYLNQGEMFAAYAWVDSAGVSSVAPGFALASETDPIPHICPDAVLGCMIVADEGIDEAGLRIAEVKNLAVTMGFQRHGVGRALLDFAAARYAPTHDALQVGTGDSPLTVPFYEACGFARSGVLPNFFIDNYDHPIIEAGVQLRDMVYLRRKL